MKKELTREVSRYDKLIKRLEGEKMKNPAGRAGK